MKKAQAKAEAREKAEAEAEAKKAKEICDYILENRETTEKENIRLKLYKK